MRENMMRLLYVATVLNISACATAPQYQTSFDEDLSHSKMRGNTPPAAKLSHTPNVDSRSAEQMYKAGYAQIGELEVSATMISCRGATYTELSAATSKTLDNSASKIQACRQNAEPRYAVTDLMPAALDQAKLRGAPVVTVVSKNKFFWQPQFIPGKCLKSKVEFRALNWSEKMARDNFGQQSMGMDSTCIKYEQQYAESLIYYTDLLLWRPDSALAQKQLDIYYLKQAISDGNVKIAKTIVARGVDPANEPALRGSMHAAVAANSIPMVDYLLQLGISIDARVKNDETALMQAVIKRDHAMVRNLLKRGANPNCSNGDPMSALDIALKRSTTSSTDEQRREYAAIAETLKQHGGTWSPILLEKPVADPAWNDVLIALIEQGSWTVNSYIPETDTSLLMLAARNGNIELFNWLVKHGADIHYSGVFGNAVNAAAGGVRAKEAARADMIRYLVSHNTNAARQSLLGNAPLHEWVMNDGPNTAEIIDLLVHGGADINAIMYDGETPLMKAALYRNAEAVKALLRHKPNLALRNKKGETALNKAEQISGNKEVVALLRAAGAPR